MRPLRIFLHFLQFFPLILYLITGHQGFIWLLALATVGVFADMLTDRGEKVATPLETIRTLEESKLLKDISRK